VKHEGAAQKKVISACRLARSLFF